MKKADSNVPGVELTEIGPHMNFVLRRTKLASDDLFKTACKKPLQLKVIKIMIVFDFSVCYNVQHFHRHSLLKVILI